MRVGITDTMETGRKSGLYASWLHRLDPSVEIVVLSYRDRNAGQIKAVDALLLTGGGDVHPGYYGMPDALPRARGVDEQRDEFEFDLIERALDSDLPILGICRGMQVMNVFLGGSLIVDLPSSDYENHSSREGHDSEHTVQIAAQSMLNAVTGASELSVNSSHHQAVSGLGNGLMMSAMSPNGVIEAAEWILKDRMPFLLLVQWHPERMKEFESPASKNIVKHFFKEIQYSKNQKSPSTSIIS